MLEDFPIFGDVSQRPNIDFSSEDLVNLYLIADPAGKKKFALRSTPGLEIQRVIKFNNDESRGLFVYEGDMYGVFGESVYKFNSSITPTLIGTIGTDTGVVSISANNGHQVIFVDGVHGYIYNNQTNLFLQISSSGFPAKPLNVRFLDGYFAIPLGESNYYQVSALNDGNTWDATVAVQIQAYPGNNVGVGVVNRRLYFFKDQSTEVWYNAGQADFPFRRDNTLLFNFGCLTAASIANDFGYLFWLARDKGGVGSVMMTTGQQAEPASDDSIDELISSFTNPSDMNAFIYKDGDRIFYVMNFNTDDMTLVYDLTMKMWHKRQVHQTISNGGLTVSKKRNLPNCHAYYGNTHFVGSYKAPVLYRMSQSYKDNAGEPIERIRVPKHFFDKSYNRMQINALQIDMQMGLGDATGEYQNPHVFLSISRDGGHVYGNAHRASVGRIGQRTVRAKFRKLGIARDFVPKISFYSPVAPFIILGAAIDFEVLAS